MLLQQLALLDGLRPRGRWRRPSSSTPSTECAKLAFADREALYGDPDFADVPLEHAALGRVQRRAPRSSSATTASGELRARAAAGCRTLVAEATTASLGVGRADAAGDTVHLDVADRFGNMVSATPSGGWLQSSPMIPALGWPLGHARADVLARGRAAVLARAAASGRARRSRPALALRDGEP